LPKYIFQEKEWMKWSSDEYEDITLLALDGSKYKAVKHAKFREGQGLPGADTIETWIGVNVFGPNGGEYETHKHETSQFFYVLHGKGKVRVGDEERIAEKGAWIFTPPGVDHHLQTIGNEDFAYILIGGNPKDKNSPAHTGIERKKSAKS